MTATSVDPGGVLAKDTAAPERLTPILDRVRSLYDNEVAPREKALAHRLHDERE